MKTYFLILTLLFFQLVNTCYSQDRGPIWEYDPGAPKDSQWPDYFAETPNYRAFGKAILGGRGEKFRWKMGPMWYRGRLTPSSVKIFIVGQEGAQDENVTNRSFTGSTGTRMQKFINYLGINQSYLFMNTFVYTINGQYTTSEGVPPKIFWLSQNTDSVIVQHRHQMFDYMLSQNRDTLALVIGVGSAGKDSVVTWVNSHGGDCTRSRINSNYCEGKNALKGILIIGVRHPGGASARNGGASAANAIRADFRRKAEIVADFVTRDSDWLPVDRGMRRNFDKQFVYGYASIPHRDFAFGTNWRMGKRATSSNRRRAHAIQVFSDWGCYNNKVRNENGRCDENEIHRINYDDPKDLLGMRPSEMEEVDVPYESPKGERGRRQYDEGPGKFAKQLMKLWDPDYSERGIYRDLGVTSHSSFGPNGMYRGRFDQAKVIILADQMSHTDMFSGRALTGAGGQKFQSFLKAMGMQESYLILRTLPVDTMDLSTEQKISIATNDQVQDARIELLNKILQLGNTELILTIGSVAREVMAQIDVDIEVVNLGLALSEAHVDDWNSALKKIKKLDLDITDGRASWEYNGSLSIIPRRDLPASTRWWMASSGDHAARAYEYIDGQRVENPDYYKVYAPRWSNRTRSSVSDLSESERRSVELFEELGL